MPRKQIVSRTLKYTLCRCLMIDLKKKQQYMATFEIRGSYTKDEINKKGEKLFTNAKQKFIICNKTTLIEKTFVMSLEDFTRAATIQEKLR